MQRRRRVGPNYESEGSDSEQQFDKSEDLSDRDSDSVKSDSDDSEIEQSSEQQPQSVNKHEQVSPQPEKSITSQNQQSKSKKQDRRAKPAGRNITNSNSAPVGYRKRASYTKEEYEQILLQRQQQAAQNTDSNSMQNAASNSQQIDEAAAGIPTPDAPKEQRGRARRGRRANYGQRETEASQDNRWSHDMYELHENGDAKGRGRRAKARSRKYQTSTEADTVSTAEAQAETETAAAPTTALPQRQGRGRRDRAPVQQQQQRQSPVAEQTVPETSAKFSQKKRDQSRVNRPERGSALPPPPPQPQPLVVQRPPSNKPNKGQQFGEAAVRPQQQMTGRKQFDNRREVSNRQQSFNERGQYARGGQPQRQQPTNADAGYDGFKQRSMRYSLKRSQEFQTQTSAQLPPPPPEPMPFPHRAPPQTGDNRRHAANGPRHPPRGGFQQQQQQKQSYTKQYSNYDDNSSRFSNGRAPKQRTQYPRYQGHNAHESPMMPQEEQYVEGEHGYEGYDMNGADGAPMMYSGDGSAMAPMMPSYSYPMEDYYVEDAYYGNYYYSGYGEMHQGGLFIPPGMEQLHAMPVPYYAMPPTGAGYGGYMAAPVPPRKYYSEDYADYNDSATAAAAAPEHTPKLSVASNEFIPSTAASAGSTEVESIPSPVL